MSTELSRLLHNEIGDTLTRHLIQQGEPSDASERATAIALPTILAGLMAHINGSRDKATVLHDLIMGERGGKIAETWANIQGDDLHPVTELGKTLLPNIFHQHEDAVALQLAQNSSIQEASARNVLATALPLVLAVFRKQNWSAGELLHYLSAQSCWLTKLLPQGILSVLGIGSVGGLCASVASLASGLGATGTLTGINTNDEAENRAGFGLWLILGALLAGTIFGLRSCALENREEKRVSPKVSVEQVRNASDIATLSAQEQEEENHAHHHAHHAVSGTEDASSVSSSAHAMMEQAQQPLDASDVSEPNIANTATEAEVSAPAMTSTPANVENQENTPAVASTVATPSQAPASNEAVAVVENGIVKFYFATGFSKLAPNAKTVAVEAVQAGKAGKKLIISGFTDSTGNAKSNLALSKKRAEVVRAFLIKQGVSAKNIELRKPENSIGAQGKSQEGRRVEVRIED